MSQDLDPVFAGAQVIDTFLWEHSVRWHSRGADHIWLDANAKCGIVEALLAAGWKPPADNWAPAVMA